MPTTTEPNRGKSRSSSPQFGNLGSTWRGWRLCNPCYTTLFKAAHRSAMLLLISGSISRHCLAKIDVFNYLRTSCMIVSSAVTVVLLVWSFNSTLVFPFLDSVENIYICIGYTRKKCGSWYRLDTVCLTLKMHEKIIFSEQNPCPPIKLNARPPTKCYIP